MFLKRAICIYWFTKMNSFCQCAPSLRLLEWMGSCIQGPSSCNEQDGVQSLFHHRFFSDWERQLPSIGWVQAWQTRFLWFPHRKNVQNVLLLKTFWSCLDSWSDESYMCTSDTGQHGGEGVLYILTVNLNSREYGNFDDFQWLIRYKTLYIYFLMFELMVD